MTVVLVLWGPFLAQVCHVLGLGGRRKERREGKVGLAVQYSKEKFRKSCLILLRLEEEKEESAGYFSLPFLFSPLLLKAAYRQNED